MTRSDLGIGVAVAYVVLQPLMLQNPIRPTFPGPLGAVQLADLLAPLMVAWLAWSYFARRRTVKVQSLAVDGRLVLGAAVAFVAFCIASGAGTDYRVSLPGIEKYAYLMLVVVFFREVLDSPTTVTAVFRAVVFATLVYMVISVGAYLAAILFGITSPFAQIRENFPYLGRVVRLVGPMAPTSKVFGAYMLLFVVLLILGVRHIERRIYLAGFVLTAVCGLLTLGRAGFVAAAAALIAITWLHPARRGLVPALMVLIIVAGIAIQAVTVWHLELREISVDCGAPYAAAGQTQYFGWYKEPRVCRIAGGGDLTYSSYFLLKLVAAKAWASNPFFGVGVLRYGEHWQEAAGTIIPAYYANHLFPMALSTYMTLLAEMGLLGFVAWCALVGIFLQRIWIALRDEGTMRNLYITWLCCFLYTMIDLDLHNFRFLYSLLPLAAAVAWLARAQREPHGTESPVATQSSNLTDA